MKRKKALNKIQEIYHKHNGVDGYRVMQIYPEREGFSYSATTVHKYMNSLLGLKSIIRPKKPNYEQGKPHKVFTNKLKQGLHRQYSTGFDCLIIKCLRKSKQQSNY